MIKGRKLVQKIVAERIEILFELAQKEMKGNSELAKGYVKGMKRLSTHYKIEIPKNIKDKVCKRCNSILIPGLTAKVRIASHNHYVVYTCLNCKTEKHIHY